jgi:hypothetical protein
MRQLSCVENALCAEKNEVCPEGYFHCQGGPEKQVLRCAQDDKSFIFSNMHNQSNISDATSCRIWDKRKSRGAQIMRLHGLFILMKTMLRQAQDGGQRPRPLHAMASALMANHSHSMVPGGLLVMS